MNRKAFTLKERMIAVSIISIIAIVVPVLCCVLEAEELAPSDKAIRSLAQDIVNFSGINAGLCVHLGCVDGKLTANLAEQGKFVVHGLASTQQETEMARQHIASRNMHGAVSVECGSLSRLPYVDNLVNLVVVDNLTDALKNGLSLKEVMRVVCPNGVAFIGQQKGLSEADLKRRLEEAGVKDGEIIKQNGIWARIRKSRPKEMDDWTHWLHGPECNNSSTDSMAGPDARIQWIDGPFWPMAGARAAVFAGGRGFTATRKLNSDGKASWMLVARDAFNGLVLWERDMGARTYDPRLLVAVGERVFAVVKKDGPVVAFDAASGETARTYDVGFSPRAMLVLDGHLILGSEKAICSVNAATGNVRWRKVPPEGASFRFQSAIGYGQYPYMIVSDGQLLVLLQDAPKPPFSLVCYDLSSGKEVWRKRYAGVLAKCYQGVLAMLDQPAPFNWEKNTPGTFRGISVKDGRHLWDFKNVPLMHADSQIFCLGGLFWAQAPGKGLVGIDPATGAEKRRLKASITGHCGFVRTTERYFLGVYDTFIDGETGKRYHSNNMAFKNTCFLGNVPANGLTYNFQVFCGCLPYLRGFLAFAPVGEAKKDATTETGQLEKGPAYEAKPPEPASTRRPGWNTYRHDSVRSGSMEKALPSNLKMVWKKKIAGLKNTTLGKSVTQPVAAGGMVFVAAPDSCAVVALDAATGERRWQYLAGARVEVPPTIHMGRCLFGGNDGWVYCLRADDGKLVWRFRAAPREQRIMVSGRLASPWPVPGVLVENGTAFFAAGRHSGMGGIFIYAMDPLSGNVLWRKRLSTRGGDVIKRQKKNWADGLHANDLLVSNGKSIFMGRLMIDPKSGDMSLDWRGERFLISGKARSGPGLVPFGFLDDRMDEKQRYYHPMRYYLTLWGYGGVKGTPLVFSGDRVFGFASIKKKGSQYFTSTLERHIFARSIGGPDDPKKDSLLWSVKVPGGGVKALLAAGGTLFAAGIKNNSAVGGVLQAFSADNGKKLSELSFDDVPVFDGMAAANGRIYVSTQSGKVFCFGKTKDK